MSQKEEGSPRRFDAVVETAAHTIEKYQLLYGLPTIEHAETVDYRFFLQARRGAIFVVVAAYNRAREFLVVRNFSRGSGWELLGGFIEMNGLERPEGAVVRVVKRESALEVLEMTPIAVVKNVFVCGKERVVHTGLAYSAECEGSLSFIESIAGDFSSRIPPRMLASDRAVLALAKKQIERKIGIVPTEEIHSAQKFKIAIWVHEHVISPLIHPLSSALIDSSLLEAIGNPRSFLDTAVGDDNLVIKLYRKCQPFLCVANDITAAATRALQVLVRSGEDIIFTNHNALDLPFKTKFDVVLCKNTLHHMHSEEEIRALLGSMKKISRRLILMDIEDPHRSSVRARVWNWYYRTFLGDQGGYFLTRARFVEIVRNFFPERKVQFRNIATLKGNYMVAVAEEKM